MQLLTRASMCRKSTSIYCERREDAFSFKLRKSKRFDNACHNQKEDLKKRTAIPITHFQPGRDIRYAGLPESYLATRKLQVLHQ